VLIWAAISWYSAGLTLSGRITASDYVDILGNQVHPMVQLLLPNNDAVFFKDNSPIHTARSVQSWSWICTSTSSLASTITRLKYHRTIAGSLREYGGKQIPFSIISQATRRCTSWRLVQQSTKRPLRIYMSLGEEGSKVHHHHHHVHEGLGVFPVPQSRWSWSLHLFLGRPMFLRPFLPNIRHPIRGRLLKICYKPS